MQKAKVIALLVCLWSALAEIERIEMTAYIYPLTITLKQVKITEDSQRIIFIDADSILHSLVNTGGQFIEENIYDCSPYRIVPQKFIALSKDKPTKIVLRGTQTSTCLSIDGMNISLLWHYDYGFRTRKAIIFFDF